MGLRLFGNQVVLHDILSPLTSPDSVMLMSPGGQMGKKMFVNDETDGGCGVKERKANRDRA